MKSQKVFFPRCLAVLPAIDCFNPGQDPADGGGAAISPFDTVDFAMFAATGTTNYTELHLDSPADGGTMPIVNGTDSERCMLIMKLPTVGAAWSMALQLNTAEGSDTVQMQCLLGNFQTLRSSLVNASNLRYEVAGVFFTIEVGTNIYQTYLNVNHTNEVVKLSYSRLNTFDEFCVSFLAKSNV